MTDFKNIARSLLPHFWRKPIFVSYVKAGVDGLQSLHDDSYTPLETKVLEWVKYNGQHMVLEEYLNNTYDNTLRRIYIDENDVTRAFGNPLALNGEFNSTITDLGLNGETNDPEVDFGINADASSFGNNFTIFIPNALLGLDETLLRSRIDRWVAAGKIYDIQYF